MAETLTFEQKNEVTSIDNLNEDEQDSLQVGEQMQEAQDNLLAGKYKNAQELEKAHIELQKKLGEKGSAEPEPEVESQPETEAKTENKEAPVDTLLDDLWKQSQDEKFEQETLDKLRGMKPEDLANMHLNYRRQSQPREFTEQDVQQLKSIVGGDKEYGDMMQWATKTLNKQEIEMFDQVMEQGNPLAAFFAVRSLAYRYNDATGYDGKMVSGKAPKQNTDVFRSQAEVVKAMSDSRYDDDPAYRQDVMKKLERSDVNF